MSRSVPTEAAHGGSELSTGSQGGVSGGSAGGGGSGPAPRRRAWHDTVGLLARLVLGGVLLYAGASKVGQPLVSARAVQAYQILPFDLAGYVGYALPVVEIIVGLLLLLGLFTRAAALAGTLLMVAFVIGIAAAWARGLTIDCGCFGGGGQVAAEDTRYPQEIARDALFALCGLWLCVRPRTLFSLDGRLDNRLDPEPSR